MNIQEIDFKLLCSIQPFINFNQWPEINEVASTFLMMSGIDQSKKSELISFLNSFFLTRKLNDQISSVLNKVMIEEKQHIQDNYGCALEENRKFLEEYSDSLGLSKTYYEDVTYSLTLYSHI